MSGFGALAVRRRYRSSMMDRKFIGSVPVISPENHY
jgi:hypothetical protein